MAGDQRRRYSSPDLALAGRADLGAGADSPAAVELGSVRPIPALPRTCCLDLSPGKSSEGLPGIPRVEGWHRASPGRSVPLGFRAGALGLAATVPEVPGFPGPGRRWAPPRIPLKGERRRQPRGPWAPAGATWLWGLKEKAWLALNARRPAFLLFSESGEIGRLFTALRVFYGTLHPYPKCRHNHSLTRGGASKAQKRTAPTE